MSPIVVIGGSAGSFQPLHQIVAALPAHCKASIFVVSHIGDQPSILPTLLALAGPLPAFHPESGTWVRPGFIYVAPPGHHMTLRSRHIWLDRGVKVHHTRPALDPLFISAARSYGCNVIGIVLSGGGDDGAEGLRVIKRHGGETLVQDPKISFLSSMPEAALVADHPRKMSIAEIATFLMARCSV